MVSYYTALIRSVLWPLGVACNAMLLEYAASVSCQVRLSPLDTLITNRSLLVRSLLLAYFPLTGALSASGQLSEHISIMDTHK